jgi:hypothetical protein
LPKYWAKKTGSLCHQVICALLLHLFSSLSPFLSSFLPFSLSFDSLSLVLSFSLSLFLYFSLFHFLFIYPPPPPLPLPFLYPCILLAGVMAQEIALLIHNGGTGNGGKFVCHDTSHILVWEKEGYDKLLSLQPVIIQKDGPIVLSDVEQSLSSRDSHIKTLILEHPHRELGGQLTPHADLIEIAKLCKSRGVKLHLDGARIWEASGAHGGQYSLQDIASNFDTCYVSFYKGIGAITGAMLLGPNAFCVEARVWLRRFGGNLFSLAPYAISCYDGFKKRDDTSNKDGSPRMSFVQKADKMRSVVRVLSSSPVISAVLSFRPPVPETSLVHAIIQGSREDAEAARDAVAARTGVFVFDRLRGSYQEDNQRQYFEWNMGSFNGLVSDELIAGAWADFAGEINKKVRKAS